MAATRLIALHINKGKSVAACLAARTDYATNPEKTEKGELVTSYACDPMTVDEEFMLSKRMYRHITGRTQENEVIAYQIRQSFKPGEITAETANQIGYELAMRFTKGRFAFIVATHTDRAHIHNHVIFNSTSIDGTRKFQDFHHSGLALQKLSDIICLENKLSVIVPKPYSERKKRTVYPKKESRREMLCADIDRILQGPPAPKDFEDFLRLMQEAGYEIKVGKNISVRKLEAVETGDLIGREGPFFSKSSDFEKKGPSLPIKSSPHPRFIRLSSLPPGYHEADIQDHFKNPGKRQFGKWQKKSARVSLLIDVQEKMRTKGPGYARWAKAHNLKEMSKGLIFLREHGIDDLEQLDAYVADKKAQRDELLADVQAADARIEEIAALRKHIFNYSNTRNVYEAYRKAGYSRRFYEEHRADIEIHKAAKKAFDELGVRQIPRVKELNVEYAEAVQAKKCAFREYQKVKAELQESLVVKENFLSLYKAEGKEKNTPQGKMLGEER